MAAPSGTTWGSIVGGYGRVGIYIGLSNTATQTKVTVSTWFWSKYSVTDSNNSYYYNNNATSATSKVGSVTIKTTIDSGEGWSTSNQVKLGESTYTYNKGTSATTRNCAVKLTNIDVVGGTMTHTRSYTIPALASYTVKYNANGGSGAPANQTKYYGAALTLSSTKPTRNGYTFVGWGSSATATSPVNQPSGTYTGNAAYTYYAIWKKTITLTYNANGGSGAPANQSKTIYNATTSNKFTLSSSKPTRTGYTFLGWSTSNTATSSSYSAGGSITLSSSDTLYAVWKINTYTVTYNANGGNGAPSKQTKTYGKTLTLSTAIPTKTSVEDNGMLTEYTFKGWATSPTSTSVAYKSGASYTANAAVTLYAVWSKEVSVNLYDVIYNTNGGSDVISQIKVKGETLKLRSTIPVKSGYTFSGWGLSPDSTTVSYNAGQDYTLDDDAVLYAIWTPWSHNVVFDANGGVGDIPDGFTKTSGENEPIIPSCSLTKKGHVFKCWSTQPSGSGGENYCSGDGYSGIKNGGTVTLYAIWDLRNICLYANGMCKAGEFIEDDSFSINSDGTIHYIQFIEGSPSIYFDNTAFYATEFLERAVVYLTDESDIYLTDETGNRLTTII